MTIIIIIIIFFIYIYILFIFIHYLRMRYKVDIIQSDILSHFTWGIKFLFSLSACYYLQFSRLYQQAFFQHFFIYWLFYMRSWAAWRCGCPEPERELISHMNIPHDPAFSLRWTSKQGQYFRYSSTHNYPLTPLNDHVVPWKGKIAKPQQSQSTSCLFVCLDGRTCGFGLFVDTYRPYEICSRVLF